MSDWENRMAEAAVAEVARHVIAHTVRRYPPEWMDFADIGEHDWAAVTVEVERQLRRLAAQEEKFEAAYKHLAARAGGAA